MPLPRGQVAKRFTRRHQDCVRRLRAVQPGLPGCRVIEKKHSYRVPSMTYLGGECSCRRTEEEEEEEKEQVVVEDEEEEVEAEEIQSWLSASLDKPPARARGSHGASP